MAYGPARKERRENRQCALGIDCIDRLTWKDWTPGHEYVRKILVKNVDCNSQTIQLSLPIHRKVFRTPFPEPVTLSSGVSHEIRIAFCPTELVELHDAITITVDGRGSFQVHLDCLTPYAKLSVPSHFDFDYCGIGSTAHAQVQVRNTGTAPVEFAWEVPAPFCVLPSHAVLDQGEAMQLTLLFTPADACALVAQAVCRLSGMDEVIATLKISGIGKYPYICFQEDDKPSTSGAESGTQVLSLEGHMNGPGVSSRVHLCNPSAVPATVRLRRLDDNLTSPFRLVVDGGAGAGTGEGAIQEIHEPFTLSRGAVRAVRVEYTPSSPGVQDTSTFQFDCLGGNSLRLELKGTTAGPRITTLTSSIDYGAVDLERCPSTKERTRYITVRNTSMTEAAYTWVGTSPGAAFLMVPNAGVLAAQSSTQVAITFQPTEPILYYRRLYLLVEGAADVTGVDVFGGAYNACVRPPTLRLADVETAVLRAERGLGLLTPSQLEQLAAAAAADAEDYGDAVASAGQAEQKRVFVTPETLDAWRRIEEDVHDAGVVLRGAKKKIRAPLRRLESTEGELTVYTPFGMDAPPLCVLGANDTRGQAVTVMNTSDTPAVATWCVPSSATAFSVTPAQQAVPPHSSAVFHLHYSSSIAASTAVEAPAASTLECYVNYDCMSAFYLAPDGCVTPPQCFTVTCTAVSGLSSSIAAPSTSTKLPVSAQMQSAMQVCLPACRLGGASYQVVAVHNTSSTTVARYAVREISLKQVSAVGLPPNMVVTDADADADDGARPPQHARDVDSSVFAVFPSAGVVPPRGHQLLLVKFNPTEAARYEATATLMWNAPLRPSDPAAATDVTAVSLLGEVCLPQLQWRNASGGDASDIAFPPSCITGEVPQQAWLCNPTGLSVAFRFDISAGLLGVLRMEPEWGVVPGGAHLPVTLFFGPQQPRRFTGYVQLYLEDGAAATADNDVAGSTQERHYRQQLPVQGDGAFAEVELEPRRIDTGEAADTREQQAALTLYNSGYCDVQYEVRTLSTNTNTGVTWTPPHLHNGRGVLPARTHTSVLMTAKPVPGVAEYVLYALVSGLSTNLPAVADAATVAEARRHPHCHWVVRAAHPAVQIVNVHFPGVARPFAWRQLSANAINAQLAVVDNASAAQDDEAAADAFSFAHYASGLVPLTMDLGVAHADTAAASITVTLQNTGDCPAPFSVMLPMQHEANVERWCLEDADLADLQHVVDNGIISVTPQQGRIEIGETVQLRVIYTHGEVGAHRLPMLLRVGDGNGRRVAMVLEGRTLAAEVQALELHHESVYELMPVALGDMEPPLQYVTVTNPMAEPVAYTVDTASLQAHAQEHYGFPVFQCADPHGTVAPRGTACIGFYFRPLEAMEYRVTVLLQTAQGEGYELELVGSGYHPRKVAKASVMQWVEDALTRVPAVPPLIPRAYPWRLVDDVCTLGAVPYYSLCRRTCTLLLSADCPTALQYAWQPSSDIRRGDAQMALFPAEGVLQPGEQQTVQLRFYTGSTSQVLEHLLVCRVTPCPPSMHAIPRRSKGGHSNYADRGRLGQPAVADVDVASASAEPLCLFVQARVMPRDDFAQLYARNRLGEFYMPALHSAHTDPMDLGTTTATSATSAQLPAPSSLPAPPLPSTSKAGEANAEATFVMELMDELLRNVVAAPPVHDSFTTLCPLPRVTYASMRALHKATHGATDMAKKVPQSQEEDAQMRESRDTAAAVATEGMLEELLRGVLGDVVVSVA